MDGRREGWTEGGRDVKDGIKKEEVGKGRKGKGGKGRDGKEG